MEIEKYVLFKVKRYNANREYSINKNAIFSSKLGEASMTNIELTRDFESLQWRMVGIKNGLTDLKQLDIKSVGRIIHCDKDFNAFRELMKEDDWAIDICSKSIITKKETSIKIDCD